MAGTAATAWRKIAADDEVAEDPFVGLEPQLGGTEPAFEPLKDAVLSSTAVSAPWSRVSHSRRRSSRCNEKGRRKRNRLAGDEEGDGRYEWRAQISATPQ